MFRRFVSFLLLLLAALLAPMAQAAPAKRMTATVTDNGNGTVTLTWEDPNGHGPYTLGFFDKMTASYARDEWNCDLAWTVTEPVEENTYTFGDLLPGRSYWLVVQDSQGSTIYVAYDAEPVQPFHGMPITMGVKLRKQGPGGLEAVKAFSAKAIAEASDDVDYGARIQLDYGYLREARTYHGLVVLTAPTGAYVTVADELTFPQNSKYTFWNFYPFTFHFDVMADVYGEIPTGAYTLSLYLDGQHVADYCFEVGE